MSFYRRYPTQLPPQPFTAMLAVVDDHAAHHECTVSSYAKLGLPVPEEETRRVRAMRAVERILVGIERFWDTVPPAPMSIKEMIARFEATKAKPPVFVDPHPTPPKPAAKPALETVKASASLFGGDDD